MLYWTVILCCLCNRFIVQINFSFFFLNFVLNLSRKASLLSERCTHSWVLLNKRVCLWDGMRNMIERMLQTYFERNVLYGCLCVYMYVYVHVYGRVCVCVLPSVRRCSVTRAVVSSRPSDYCCLLHWQINPVNNNNPSQSLSLSLFLLHLFSHDLSFILIHSLIYNVTTSLVFHIFKLGKLRLIG